MRHGEGRCPHEAGGAVGTAGLAERLLGGQLLGEVAGRPDYALIFPGLAPWQGLASGRPEALAGLCRAMCVGDAPLDPGYAENNPDIPAGYTYFGQFVSHDLTQFMVGRRRQKGLSANRSLVTPSLDLDCVYGHGPRLEPLLYEPSEAVRDEPRYLLRTGPLTADGRPRDLPRLTEVCPGLAGGREGLSVDPLVADERNDDHLLISQLHLVFVRLHNRVARLLRAGGASNGGASNEAAFADARRFVELCYRNIVRRDYLRRLLQDEVYDDLLRAEPRFLFLPEDSPLRRTGAALPLEFAQAVGRFGHSMVRGSYPVNELQAEHARLHSLLGFSGSEPQPRFPADLNLPVREDWMIDWRPFFGLDDRAPIPSRRLGPLVNRDLFGRRPAASAEGLLFIGQADLLRSAEAGLPSGQAVARALAAHAAGHLDVEVLTGERMLPAPLAPNRPRSNAPLADFLGRHRELLDDTPLFYYALQEAAVLGEGRRLGPVGSFVLGLTFKLVLPDDPASERRGVGSMADLFRILESDDATLSQAVRDELAPSRQPESAGVAD